MELAVALWVTTVSRFSAHRSGPLPQAAERLCVGGCLSEGFSTTNSAPRARLLGCSLSEFPSQPKKANGPSTRVKSEQDPDLDLQVSRSQRFPAGTGPQFSFVASVLYVKSAITKGEEAMAVRGQKMLNDPVSFQRGRTLPLLGGGGIELFHVTAFCRHQLQLSTHFRCRTSSQGLQPGCPSHKYTQINDPPSPPPHPHHTHTYLHAPDV